MTMYATAANNTKTFQRSRKNYSVGKQIKAESCAEKNLAIMKEIQNLIGDDIPWANEDEMIRDLAEMRRQRFRS